MDWTKLSLPAPTSTASRPRVGSLGNLDYWKLRVIERLINKSQSAILQTAVLTYLSRTWAEHEARLVVEANDAGMTPEEYFMRLVAEALEAKQDKDAQTSTD